MPSRGTPSPTRPLSQQPSAAEPAGRSWLPPLPTRPGERYDAPRPLPAGGAREPRAGRVPWWMWPTVGGLALALGLFGGAVGSAPRAGPRRRHTGAGLGRARRRRHGLDSAAAGRERLGDRGRAAAPAQHRPDLRGVRGRGRRRHRLGVRARPAGSRHHQQPRRGGRRRGRRPDRDRGPGRQPLRGGGGRPEPGLRPGRALFAEKATKLRPASLGASRVLRVGEASSPSAPRSG